MTRTRKASVVIIAFLFFGLLFRELSHFYRYRHFVPLGLHADVDVTTSNDIIGVDGTAKIYHASLTNYGLLPATIVLCDYRVSGAPEIEVNYVVERWDRDVNKWKFVPEWDFYGYGLFCQPVFEVNEEHLVRRRLWPWQSLRVGEGIPGQLGGFRVGDNGRFTIFLRADRNWNKTLSTAPFRVDQEVKNHRTPSPFSH
jgi:hypothetical protein